jgi:hypothetical protein
MGFTDNSQRPLTGTPKKNPATNNFLLPVLYLPSDPAELSLIKGAITDYVLPEKTPLFDFDRARLADRDKDGFPEYYPRYGGRLPYVFISSSSYQFHYPRAPRAELRFGQPFVWLNLADGTNNIDSSLGDIPQAVPAPRPFITKLAPTFETKQFATFSADLVAKTDFAASDTFQIMAPGLDGEYGLQSNPSTPGGTMRYPEGPYEDKRIRDNVTNFAGGTLESKLP